MVSGDVWGCESDPLTMVELKLEGLKKIVGQTSFEFG